MCLRMYNVMLRAVIPLLCHTISRHNRLMIRFVLYAEGFYIKYITILDVCRNLLLYYAGYIMHIYKYICIPGIQACIQPKYLGDVGERGVGPLTYLKLLP